MNHGLYTDTAWNVPVLFQTADATALDLSGDAYLADLLLNGAVIFSFKSSGAGAGDGQIDVTQASAGVLVFTATIAQHQAVSAGFYRIHLKRDRAIDTWQAEGNVLIGAPGATETYIAFDAPTVEAASAVTYAALAQFWAQQALVALGASVDRELVTTIYQVTGAFTGASAGDVLTCVQVVDVSAATPSTVAVLWRNHTTAADLGSAPSFANLALMGAQTTPNVAFGVGNADAKTQRVTLASDGTEVTALISLDTDLGALTSSAAPSDGSGNYSVIAALKRVLLNGAALLSRLPSALGVQAAGNSISTVQAADVTIIGTSGLTDVNVDLLSALNNTTTNGWFDAASFQSGTVQIIAPAGAAGQVFFEQTNDVTNAPAGVPLRAVEVSVINANPNVAAIAIAASTNRLFKFSIDARYIRARISTAFTGAGVQAVASFSQRPTAFNSITVQQGVAANLLATVSISAAQTLAAVTSANLGIPGIVADVVSAALTITTTTAAIVPTFGTSYEVNIPVTAVAGTSPTLDVVVQESDDTGVNWFDVYHFQRITATGSYRSPKLLFTGNRLRYVQTVGGAGASFTRAINRLQSSDFCDPIRRLIDRSVNLQSAGAATAGLNVPNCRNAQLMINIGTAVTPPALQLEGSDDGGLSWYALGSPLTAVASSTVQLTLIDINAQQIRARVSTAGATVVAGYVLIKGF